MTHMNVILGINHSEALQDIEDAKLGAKLYSEYLASGSKSTSWADIKKENGL